MPDDFVLAFRQTGAGELSTAFHGISANADAMGKAIMASAEKSRMAVRDLNMEMMNFHRQQVTQSMEAGIGSGVGGGGAAGMMGGGGGIGMRGGGMMASRIAMVGAGGQMSIRSLIMEGIQLQSTMAGAGAAGVAAFTGVGAAALATGYIIKTGIEWSKQADESWKAAGLSAQGYFGNLLIGFGVRETPKISSTIDFHAVGLAAIRNELGKLQEYAKSLTAKVTPEERATKTMLPAQTELAGMQDEYGKLAKEKQSYLDAIHGTTNQQEKQFYQQQANDISYAEEELGKKIQAKRISIQQKGQEETKKEIFADEKEKLELKKRAGEDTEVEENVFARAQAAGAVPGSKEYAMIEAQEKGAKKDEEDEDRKQALVDKHLDETAKKKQEDAEKQFRLDEKNIRTEAEGIFKLQEKVSGAWAESAKGSQLASMSEEGTSAAYTARAEYMAGGNDAAEKTAEASMRSSLSLEQIVALLSVGKQSPATPTVHTAGGARR
jgi:hypothetical protein